MQADAWSQIELITDPHSSCQVLFFFYSSRRLLALSDCIGWLGLKNIAIHDTSRVQRIKSHHWASLLQVSLGKETAVQLGICLVQHSHLGRRKVDYDLLINPKSDLLNFWPKIKRKHHFPLIPTQDTKKRIRAWKISSSPISKESAWRSVLENSKAHTRLYYFDCTKRYYKVLF